MGKLMRQGFSVSGLTKRLHGLGPYLLIELLLPGGTLIALLMYFYRSRRPVAALVLARTGRARSHRTARAHEAPRIAVRSGR